MKRSKQNYFKKYFECNLNNSKNTWKGIKCIMTMKNVITTVPRTLSHGVNTTTNPVKLLTSLITILPQLLKLQSRTLIIPKNTFLNT